MPKLNKTVIFALGLNLFFVPLSESLPQDSKGSSADVYDWLRIFAKVVSTVERRSFRNVDIKGLILEAIKSAVAKKIDAHSAFLDDFDQISQCATGAFPGIGVSVFAKAQDDDFLVIVDVVEESPAQKAGIKPSDRIIAVNDEKVRGLSTDEVVNKMKGKRGTFVKLRVLRNGKPMEFEITRDTIVEQTSNGYFLPDQEVYYFSLKMFSERATAQLKNLLCCTQNAQKCRGIILDIRDNPGGVLETAIEIASLFLPSGLTVVSTVNGANAKSGQYKTAGTQVYNPQIPLFILTNNFTASAAELLAGALRYYSIAEDSSTTAGPRRVPMVFVVGDVTHGKGSVQEVIPIGNGCALKLTTMLYLLPDDSSIQETGVEPDIKIPYRCQVPREVQWMIDMFGREKSLKNHITHLEVDQVRSGMRPDVSSKFDAQTDKARQELESKEKESEEDFVATRVNAGEVEKAKAENIAKNYMVGICVNMISLLDFWQKSQHGQKILRSKALEFLNKTFAVEGTYKVDKI